MDGSRRINTVSDIRISDRKRIDISGVDEVLSYDDRTIILSVCGTRTVVEGEELKVTVLSVQDGEISAVGKVNAVVFEEATAVRKGLLSGIFRR